MRLRKMFDLMTKVKLDDNPGVVIGRTIEEDPRYDIKVNGEIIQNVKQSSGRIKRDD